MKLLSPTESKAWNHAGVLQILCLGLVLSGCSRLDDGVQRSSFVTVILDEMQRKGTWGVGVAISPSEGAWPFSVEETVQQLRQDGFEVQDDSILTKFLQDNCGWEASGENGSIALKMDNSWDNSRFHYWVYLDISGQCQFQGLTAILGPEDGPMG